jgi:Protein of unknown function (DUF1501)
VSTMKLSRRHALMSGLAGMGGVALRALATGLPVSFLLDPVRALADGLPTCGDAAKAQFFILSTSASGDPLNANAPGCYADPNITHSAAPEMAASTFQLGSQQVKAAKPWADLNQAMPNRLSFWHLMTKTPVHPDEPNVLRMMGAIRPAEMFPSLLSKHLASCLGTVLAQPITVGANSPSEGLSYDGAALPILPPVALKDTLLSAPGALTTLQPLRDQTLNTISGILKTNATKAQKAYIDSLITSQAKVRDIPQNLMTALNGITDNSMDAQITVHFGFGGDNHADTALAGEAAATVDGAAAIGSLMSQLQAAGLQDQVSFLTLNVFGRTLTTKNGRNHNPNHQVSVAIGKPFRAGVIGGVAPVKTDFGATAIDSTTGASSGSGDVAAIDSLASFGKSVMAAVGIEQTVIDTAIPVGKVIRGGLV